MTKHKYLVSFYRFNRTYRMVCTRTRKSVIKFALSKFLKGKGVFTIKRLDK